MPARELRPLPVAECIHLLHSIPIGRVIYTEGALPAVLPVRFTLSDGRIVVRCARDRSVERLDRAMVGFEVDRIDADSGTGWSILVLGEALVVGPERIAEVAGRPIPLPPDSGDAFLVIDIEHVAGRRHGPKVPADR